MPESFRDAAVHLFFELKPGFHVAPSVGISGIAVLRLRQCNLAVDLVWNVYFDGAILEETW